MTVSFSSIAFSCHFNDLLAGCSGCQALIDVRNSRSSSWRPVGGDRWPNDICGVRTIISNIDPSAAALHLIYIGLANRMQTSGQSLVGRPVILNNANVDMVPLLTPPVVQDPTSMAVCLASNDVGETAFPCPFASACIEEGLGPWIIGKTIWFQYPGVKTKGPLSISEKACVKEDRM